MGPSIPERMSNFSITIGNVTDVHQNSEVYSHGEPAPPASGNLTINLDPPQLYVKYCKTLEALQITQTFIHLNWKNTLLNHDIGTV